MDEYRIYKKGETYFIKKHTKFLGKDISYYIRDFHIKNNLNYFIIYILSFLLHIPYLYQCINNSFGNYFIFLSIVLLIIQIIYSIISIEDEEHFLRGYKKLKNKDYWDVKNITVKFIDDKKRKKLDLEYKKDRKQREKRKKKELKKKKEELILIVKEDNRIIEGQELEEIKKKELRLKKLKRIV